jgi:serine/threonine-protein kinase
MTVITERLSAALAGRYRIERHLGEGGMATVYLAEDLKHDRKVAVKVLKPELAAVLGADRFVVEIKTTASLQHPHILPLFDSGTVDGFLFYVMPFIKGETLREKLNRERQLGVDEAVRIAREVADALDYAHRNGVIHRDIKPENILLHDGRPMVADFGIALAVSAAAGGRMTETGLSLGTPHYMSPEQATAEREITARSDEYSLASVLYEMLAGVPPHEGGTAQQTIMRILTDTARPLGELRKSVPPNVSAAVAKALEKLPADRFETVLAFSEALADRSYTGADAPQRVARLAGPVDWRSRIAIPAMALSALLMTVLAWQFTRPVPAPRVARYEVAWSGSSLGENLGDNANLTVSPDGSRLVTAHTDGGQRRLFVRRSDQLEPTELPGTEGASNPSFSPDGQRVAFMQGPTIRTIDLNGGPPVLVTDSAVGVPGLAWGFDGYIYFDKRGVGPLMRVRETGGNPEAVSRIDSTANELQHVWPEPLPNGRGVVMIINRGGPGQGASPTDAIAVLDLKTGRHRELFRGVFARYATSGHLLYVTRAGELLAVPFDQDRLEVTGPAVSLAKGLFVRTTGTGAVDLSISRDGTLWYTTGSDNASGLEIGWSTRDGRFSPLVPPISGLIEDADLSPDGEQIALVLVTGADGGHVWVTRPGSAERTRLTFERAFDGVTWNPDNRHLLARSPPGEVFRMSFDGSEAPSLLPGLGRSVLDLETAPNGEEILYAASNRTTIDIYSLTPAKDTAPRLLVKAEGAERSPTLSPDGRWLLYSSSRSVPGGVFIRPYPNTDGNQRQISGSGRTPRWSRDGREIFYRTFVGDSLVAVPVQPGANIAFGAPRALFSMQGVTKFDVAPDGQRFLLVRERGGSAPKRLFVVENFHEELKSRVTARK